MKWIMKLRWAILVFWLAAAVVLMIIAPPMADLVREKGELKLPDGYPSSLATEGKRNIIQMTRVQLTSLFILPTIS